MSTLAADFSEPTAKIVANRSAGLRANLAGANH